MQYLELKVKTGRVKRLIDGNLIEIEKKLPYTQLIEDVLDHLPPNGFTGAEMRARARISKALDELEGTTLELEDSDAEKLKDCVKKMRWGFRADAFVEFEDDVLAMEKRNGSAKNSGRRKR